MAKFRVGQRVKKVRGEKHLGMTAVVQPGMTTSGFKDGADMLVVYDEFDGLWHSWHELFEPLTPPHEACDPEFAESIRRLTDSVSA